MKKSLFIVLMAIGVLSSCTQSEDELFEDSNNSVMLEELGNSHALTAEQATENALAFLKEYHGINTRSFSAMNVENVVACKASDVIGDATRAALVNDGIAFYAINLKDEKGFILAAADDRYEPIYAYIETGHYENVDSTAGGFKWFIDVLAQRAVDSNDSVLLKKTNITTRGLSTIVGPYLTTKWGINSPYNMHTYSSTCTSQGVALAQIASYYECPDSVSYSLSNSLTIGCAINWGAIMAVSNYQNGKLVLEDSIASQVSHLIRYIEGVYPTETFWGTYYALQQMANAGFHAGEPYTIYAFNSDSDVRSYLDDEELIYARGSVTPASGTIGQVSGKAWVIDGYNGNKFHCNWGLDGNFDGYFFSSGFSPYPGVTYNYQLAYQPIY